jgi:hypothetical protein
VTTPYRLSATSLSIRFEVFTAVNIHILWIMTPYNLLGNVYQHFGGIHRFHLSETHLSTYKNTDSSYPGDHNWKQALVFWYVTPYPGRCLLVFRRNLLPPCSGSRSNQRSLETSVNMNETKCCHIRIALLAELRTSSRTRSD